MSEDNTKAVVEALLFASDKPLSIEQMRDVLDHLKAEEIRSLLAELKSEYETSCRGISITEVAGGFQMVTPSSFAPFLKKLYKGRSGEKLSKPALETLAIIAYKQPITKLEIESLRSVNVDGVISSLVEKNLIRITGRKKAPGRPFVFGTSKIFLEHFGLNSLDDLPKMDKFSELKPVEEKKDESEKPAQKY